MASNQTKTNGSVPVHQQILALVSAPFGDSPLLKNLLPVSIFIHLGYCIKSEEYIIIFTGIWKN
jgi:hypothetical protein